MKFANIDEPRNKSRTGPLNKKNAVSSQSAADYYSPGSDNPPAKEAG
jgi:hypothetical protein